MLSIGEFSKICQVSIKTLHHYDKIGLLKPERVDNFTGYRYYSQRQLEKMLLIQRFKRYEFSLEEIRELLLCTDRRALFYKLQSQIEKLSVQKQQTELIIHELSAHLDSFERTGNIMEYQNNYKIQLVETPDRIVLSCRRNMGVDEFGRYYSTLYERIARDNLTPDGLTGAVYHDKEFDRENSDIELIVGIREAGAADRTLPGALCAKTVHKGPYSSLSDAYGALTKWIENEGYVWAGAPYDLYIKSRVDGVSPAEWETEVYFPVRKEGAEIS